MIVLSYDRYRGYNASHAETRTNKRARAAGVCVLARARARVYRYVYKTIFYSRVSCTHMCVHMRMRKHRPRVKAFDAMFVVKDELFSTRRRLLACTWRDKSSWIFRTSMRRLGNIGGECRRRIRAADRIYRSVIFAYTHLESLWLEAERDRKIFRFINEFAKAFRLIDINVVYVARDGHWVHIR